MRIAVVALGAVVLLAALIGFVRRLWRPPGGDGNRGYGVIPGETPTHEGAAGIDGGGHSGGI